MVSDLQARGYLTVTPSAGDRREKIITLTPRAVSYLTARRAAVRAIEADLRSAIGADGIAEFCRFLDTLAGDASVTSADYPVMRALRWLDSEDRL